MRLSFARISSAGREGTLQTGGRRLWWKLKGHAASFANFSANQAFSELKKKKKPKGEE